ncbi:hypothetical protein DRQ36_02110 [bacterium]|nr:MAG: hypothetical protein DRQ36_02110 [bacterium]
MRTKTIVTLLIAVWVLSGLAGKINFHHGGSEVGEVLFDGSVFLLDDKEVERDSVKKVFLGDVRETTTEEEEQYALSDEQIAEWWALADEMEAEYPEANGVIFHDYSRQTLTSDGREVKETRFAGKVITQEAKWWSNLAWYTVEGIDRIKILYARSIAPDGTITNYSPEDITYSEPTRGTLFFGKGQSVSLNIPGVELGCIVDYGYIHETYAPEDPELFMTRFFFQSDEPVKTAECHFEVPKGRTLYYETFLMEPDDPFIGNSKKSVTEYEGSPEPVITETDSSVVYSWKITDIEPRIYERYWQGYLCSSPGVFGSLYPDYEYYHKRFGEIHREHMKLTPELDSLAKEIVGDAKTEKEKVARLYHWVQRNIRYISVKGALASRFGGHYAELTLDNKYGDCSDKAVFFATLCEAVGIEAYPIIVMTNDVGFLDRKRFVFWGGNHAINEVWWDGEPHVLDATNNLFRFPYYPTNDCDLWYANYARGEIVYNPPIPPEDNSMHSRTIVELDPDGTAAIRDSFWYTGTMEAMYRGWFEYTPKIKHRNVIERFVAQRKAGAKLGEFEISNIDDISLPLGLQFDYTVKDYWVEAGDYYLIDVPALRYYFNEIELKNREYGIKVDWTYMRTHDVLFVLPEGYSAKFIPDEFHLENPYLNYTASFERVGDNIRFTDKFQRTKLRIPISEYESYKSDVEKILAYLKERIFLVEN